MSARARQEEKREPARVYVYMCIAVCVFDEGEEFSGIAVKR